MDVKTKALQPAARVSNADDESRIIFGVENRRSIEIAFDRPEDLLAGPLENILDEIADSDPSQL